MNSQERELLTTFLTNLGAARVADPDPEAQSMIRSAVAAKPEAPYLLVQQALMQQAALSQAQARIADLEAQLRKAPAPDAGSGSGFLSSAGWATPRAAAGSAPLPAAGAPPSGGWSAAPPPQARSGMGDFLRGAATTAAGVAGGALLFEGIEHLIGGRHGVGGFLGGGAPMGGIPEIVENNTVINEYLGSDSPAGADPTLFGGGDPWGAVPDGDDPLLVDDPGSLDDPADDGDPSGWV